jgi:hypothetical protein
MPPKPPGAGGEAGVNAMADAAEVLSVLYECFGRVSDAGAVASGLPPGQSRIRALFSMRVSEVAHCAACNRRSHGHGFEQFFHTIASAALREAALPASPPASFEARLAQLMAATKSCDRDPPVLGCGAPTPVSFRLDAAPRVYTLSLAWPTDRASGEEVAATFAALGTSLHPSRVYCEQPGAMPSPPLLPPPARPPRYDLRALVCFYGAHYLAFARARGGGPGWTRFDDGAVTHLPDWDALADAAARGHLQPTVLFYHLVE